MTQLPGPQRSPGDTASGPLAVPQSDEPADRGQRDASGTGADAQAALAEALLAHEWRHPGRGFRTAHAEHTFDGACALCRGDVEAIVGFVVAQGWRPPEPS